MWVICREELERERESVYKQLLSMKSMDVVILLRSLVKDYPSFFPDVGSVD